MQVTPVIGRTEPVDVYATNGQTARFSRDEWVNMADWQLIVLASEGSRQALDEIDRRNAALTERWAPGESTRETGAAPPKVNVFV